MRLIRPETESDFEAIDALLHEAFKGPAEARLVRALRSASDLVLGLVAIEDGRCVGHVACSPMRATPVATRRGLGLAPLAVDPQCQRRGIGRTLLAEAVAAARRMGFDYLAVLGDPAYYGRAGFIAAQTAGLASAYEAGDAFRVLALRPDGLPPGPARLDYAPAFPGL